MNCNLTNEDRIKGNRCRSWDCIPCKDFGLSVNDANIVNIHMHNMDLKQKLALAVEALEFISKTDISENKPDFIWLNDWRNTRKQIARETLAKIGGE